MSIHYPYLLLLLLLVPFILHLRHGRRRQTLIRFSDGHALRQIPPTAAVLLQPVLPILFGLGLCLLIVAASRPQRGLEESRVRTEAVDIVLLVDVSTSMRAIDFSTSTEEINRLDAAKKVIERFVQSRSSDRIGMVVFAGQPYTLSPLTLDHSWLLQQMTRAEPGMVEDGTAIGDAIASAVNRLRQSTAKSKVVILLTDGINNAGQLSPDNAAQAAKALGIKIYTVGAGTSGIVQIPVQDPYGRKYYVRERSDIDERLLQEIAASTDALYFRATDLTSLKKVYDQIDTMEKTEINVEQFTRFEERFQPFVMLGLLCLGLEKLLALTRLGRLP